MHFLQSKCACDLFGHPLGLNLWLWYSGPPSLPICYAKQLWMIKWCEIMMVLPGRGVFEAKKVTSESDWALIHCDRCFADERIEKKKNETKRKCLNPLFFPLVGNYLSLSFIQTLLLEWLNLFSTVVLRFANYEGHVDWKSLFPIMLLPRTSDIIKV